MYSKKYRLVLPALPLPNLGTLITAVAPISTSCSRGVDRTSASNGEIETGIDDGHHNTIVNSFSSRSIWNSACCLLLVVGRAGHAKIGLNSNSTPTARNRNFMMLLSLLYRRAPRGTPAREKAGKARRAKNDVAERVPTAPGTSHFDHDDDENDHGRTWEEKDRPRFEDDDAARPPDGDPAGRYRVGTSRRSEHPVLPR